MPDQAIILLADDNPADVTLTQRALRAAHLPNPVHIVTTGQEVIEYLTGAVAAARAASAGRANPRFSGGRIPLLILLDLNLPDLTGFEVLEWIRTHETLARVPVVIYTGSENASDANRAMHLGANSYWVKPSSFQGLVNLMQLLKPKIGALELHPGAGEARRAMPNLDPEANVPTRRDAAPKNRPHTRA
jgi:CheY-like chemotaxis protein